LKRGALKRGRSPPSSLSPPSPPSPPSPLREGADARAVGFSSCPSSSLRELYVFRCSSPLPRCLILVLPVVFVAVSGQMKGTQWRACTRTYSLFLKFHQGVGEQ
jgi:hypothetical protein